VVRVRKLTKEEELLRKGAIVAGLFLEKRKEMEERVKELEREILDLRITYQDPDRGDLPAWVENRIEALEKIQQRIKLKYYL